jgi:hypothetical protein
MVSCLLQFVINAKKLTYIVVEDESWMKQLTRWFKQQTRREVRMVLGSNGLGICIVLSQSLLASLRLLVVTGMKIN